MPRLIEAPAVVQAAGNRPKRIEEYAGRVNSGHGGVSVARMRSPEGWREPGQRPDFEEITVVLNGTVRVDSEGGSTDVVAWRVDPLQHAARRRRRVHCGVPAGLLSRNRPSR
jgi:hypothetical protein